MNSMKCLPFQIISISLCSTYYRTQLHLGQESLSNGSRRSFVLNVTEFERSIDCGETSNHGAKDGVAVVGIRSIDCTGGKGGIEKCIGIVSGLVRRRKCLCEVTMIAMTARSRRYNAVSLYTVVTLETLQEGNVCPAFPRKGYPRHHRVLTRKGGRIALSACRYLVSTVYFV